MAGNIDRSRQTAFIVLSSIIMAVVVVVMTLRFISRKYIVKKVRIDDWLMLVAVVCPQDRARYNKLSTCWPAEQILTCIFCTAFIVSCTLGLGLHVPDIDVDQVPTILKVGEDRLPLSTRNWHECRWLYSWTAHIIAARTLSRYPYYFSTFISVRTWRAIRGEYD